MLARISRWTLPGLIVIAALAAYRCIVIQPEQPAIVLPRNEPVTIRPRFAEPRIATDEQLAAVLERVKPPAQPVNTNNFVHALRLWGPAADFGDAKIPSGSELRDYFLDDATFRKFAGEATPPLFYRGKTGIEVRSFDDGISNRITSSFHADDLLATLAESGIPLDTPLKLRDGEVRVADLLRTALGRFHLAQHEYEWTAITYSRYVVPQKEWRNQFGERITVDALVDEIIGHPQGIGPCNGLHRLEALAVLYRADEELRFLPPKTKLKMLITMKRVSNLLVASQTPDGYWTREWPRGEAAIKLAAEHPPTLHDKLLVTGHQLEWLALAPEQVQPPREAVVRAGQWLARTLVEMDQKDLLEAYGPYTHAARALCLWRGVEPYAAWKQSQPAAASNEQATPLAHAELP